MRWSGTARTTLPRNQSARKLQVGDIYSLWKSAIKVNTAAAIATDERLGTFVACGFPAVARIDKM
jgi:hypothetical protein